MNTTPLNGIKIAVTRPVEQAGALCDLITAAGGLAIRYPVLDIEFIVGARRAVPLPIADYDYAIFISANAVTGAVRWLPAVLPPSLQLAAVGKRTAEILRRHWPQPILTPAHNYNSEALLELPQLQSVSGKRIVIFRGEGGRELLAETLQQRGATVEYAEVYRRQQTQGDIKQLQHQAPDLIIVTSNEGLQNLYDQTQGQTRTWLLGQQLIVISERGAQRARELGFHHAAIIAARADDQGLLQAVLDWRTQHGVTSP
ncbi:MAG: uroporphyrinogen-III synthase [Gammaproteobacteria bacterium]|nr:uroporphyrinogen-III synthase [Gammaproteobacteria bacterium]